MKVFIVVFVVFLVLVLVAVPLVAEDETEHQIQLDGANLHSHTALTGFELAFPKPIDSLEAVLCSEELCRFQMLVAGWFWQPRDASEIPYTLQVDSLEPNAIFTHQYNLHSSVKLQDDDVYMIQYNLILLLPIELVYLHLDLTITANQTGTVVSRTKHLITLLPRNDVHIQNYQHLYDMFLQVNHIPTFHASLLEDVDKKQILDFIEIGTSDFATVLQSADTLGNTLQRKLLGISMEPILQFQNNLPNVPGVFKLNAAVKLNEQDGDIVNVYYLSTTAMKATQDPYIRGCFQVGMLHPYIFRLAVKSRLPAHVLQKTAIQSFSINNVLQEFVFPHFQRIKLIKLDLEGLDQLIIQQLITTYQDAGLTKVSQQWPCVLHFETNIYGGHRNETLVQQLEMLGYHIWEKAINREELMNTFQSQRGSVFRNITFDPADTLAFHCKCPVEDYFIAAELLLPANFSDEYMQHVCNSEMS